MIALYIFVVVPLWVFIRLFLVCGILVFIINLIRKIMDKTKISYLLFAFLPAFFGSIAFMVLWLSETAMSFAIFDPTYYKFKSLCNESGVYVYDKTLYQQITRQENLYDELLENFDNDDTLQQEFESNKAKYLEKFKNNFSEEGRLHHAKKSFLYTKANEMIPLQLHNGEKWRNSIYNDGDTKKTAIIEDTLYESQRVIYAYCIDNPLDSCPTDKKHIIAVRKSYIYYHPQFQLEMKDFDPKLTTRGTMRCFNDNNIIYVRSEK